MRRKLQKSFMLLYRRFRLKKYGEKLENNDRDEYQLTSFIPKEVLDTDGKINSKLELIEKYLMKGKKDDDAISDLHTVNEDYDDEADDETNHDAFVHSKKEYEDHVF